MLLTLIQLQAVQVVYQKLMMLLNHQQQVQEQVLKLELLQMVHQHLQLQFITVVMVI